MTPVRWIALPLAALSVLGWSGFLDRLEAMTRSSAALARASEEAPRTTEEAAEEVTTLPAVARLTTRQADAFTALSAALDVSAERVFSLNDSLDAQSSGIQEIVTGITDIEEVLDCVGDRLNDLIHVSRRVPESVSGIARVLGDVEQTQRKSIRHLKSINRKLTALGVAAEATDVRAPAAPEIPTIDLPEQGAADVAC